jgi:hypothetical protein
MPDGWRWPDDGRWACQLTAERIGTVMAIVEATAAGKAKPK